MSLVTSVVLQGLAVVRVTWGKLLGLSGPVSCQHLRPWVGGRIIPGNHVPNLQQCQPFLPRSLPAGNGTALVPLRKVGIGEAESPEGRSWAPNPGLWTQPWAASRALNETRTQWVLVSWAGGPGRLLQAFPSDPPVTGQGPLGQAWRPPEALPGRDTHCSEPRQPGSLKLLHRVGRRGQAGVGSGSLCPSSWCSNSQG